MKDNQLSVRMHGKPIGTLEYVSGALSFSYLKPWPENQEQISNSLPISMDLRVFSEKECLPFFEGLLPDSEDARKAIARQHGVSERNVFRLLEAIGTECSGAISFHHVDETVVQHTEIINATEKEDGEIESLILAKLPAYPLLNSIDDIRLSLAGVQQKICVVIDHLNPAEAPIGLPHSGTISTHILKPEIPNFPNSAFNEYFCLTLAKTIGLNAADVTFRKVGTTPCVIVERYDRIWEFQDHKSSVKRLHQEDFCQALRKLPSQKYQNEGGPSLKDCFDLLNDISPHLIMDRLSFIDYVFFSFILGNTDAHGKNFSILYGFHPLPRLAPLHDVLCYQIYPEHSLKMAMKIGDKYLAEDVYKRHWERFCASVNISFPKFRGRTLELCHTITSSMDIIISGHEKFDRFKEYIPFAKELQKLIEENINRFKSRIN